MVLVDFSHLMFRMLFVAISEARPRKKSGKYVTNDFSGILVYMIISQLIEIKRKYNEYGDIVICIDNSSKKYWRKLIYPDYKAHRAKDRETSEVNFDEVFEVVNDLVYNLKTYFPFKVIEVEGAEADDIISVLSKMVSDSNTGKALIYSEDKDFFQMLKYPRIDFYRPVAKKWVTMDSQDMDKWLIEHVCLGDDTDNINKIVDNINFSDSFKAHLQSFGLNDIEDIKQFDDYCSDKQTLRKNIFETFGVYKTNRKGEKTSELDIYKNKPFGPSTLWKAIDKAGGIESFLNSHPYIKRNYDMNKVLILEEHIPSKLCDNIINEYKKPSQEYSLTEIENLFKKYKLTKLMPEINILLSGYKQKELLTAEDFGW